MIDPRPSVEAERLDAIGGVAAGVAHHLNNILMVALGNIQLALMHGMGIATPRDDREMVKWLQRAADAGLANAQAQLGLSYLRGIGIQRNLETAHGLLLKAAEAGHKQAMKELAIIYKMGLGVPSDDGKAAMWAQKSE